MTARAKLAVAVRTMGAVAAVVGATMAHASTVTVHSVIDLTQWNLTSVFGFGMLGTAPDTVNFKQGDTVILDIDFLGDQTLKFDALFGIGGAVLNTTPDCPHSVASLVLHDFSGNGQASISSGQYQGCAAQLGANFPQGSPGFSSGAVEFSGVTFTFAKVSLSDSNQRSASGGRLDGGGRNGTIGHLAPITTAIPEPSSWALVFVSLAALGATLLRQGKRVSGQSTSQ